ncbi:TPA: hypothetical protein ACNH0W_002080 [Acinetobacter nosocomialis]
MLAKLVYILGCSIFIVVLISCTKKIENKPLPSSVEEQYQTSSRQIGNMLDDLNNHEVPLVKKHEILCKTYPEVYKNQYMPALLKISSDQYTEETLLRDFDAVTNFYMKVLKIGCN